MNALRENPEVLYGAVVACVIVILLTPAVGGMAGSRRRRPAGEAGA